MKNSNGDTDTAVLLLAGRDQKGLVARVSGFLYDHSANILDSDQHTDQTAGIFFQRIEFELAGMDIDFAGLRAQISPFLKNLAMDYQLRSSTQKRRVAVLASKSDHCLMDILFRARSGELRGEFVSVIGNHGDHERVVESLGLGFHYLPVTPETREKQEMRMLEILERERIDLIVLARYMQILSPALTEKFSNRIINIHHSFLPAFSGARPYHQAYDRGVKIIGATSHYVTADLDAGPIIEQETVHVSHRDSIGDLERKGRDLEKVVLARAVRNHLEDRILVYGNKTVVF